MVVVAEDVGNEGTVLGVAGVEPLEEEIEVVVGSPEVEGFRKLENELIEIGLLLGIAVGPERVGDEEGEHEEADQPEEVELGGLDEVSIVEEAILTESYLNVKELGENGAHI